MLPVRRRRLMLRRTLGALGALLVVAWLLTVPAGASTAVASSSEASAVLDPPADTTPSWTAEQAIAALTASPVAQLPGSPAVLDKAVLTGAIGDSSVKILAVPFAHPDPPTSSDMDDDTKDQLQKVRNWAYEQNADVVAVIGMQISLGGIFEQRPDTLAELQQIMVRSELTKNLLFSIAYEQSGKEAADATDQPGVPEKAVPADPADTELIATALAAEKYYAAPGVEAPDEPFEDWQDVGPDRVVRVALLPAPAPGQPLVDHLTPLAAQFPNDIVVVATGRWVQMAGPEQNLLDSAVLYGYGAFYERVVQNDLPVANLTLGMLRRVGDLRTGSVSDQAGPTTDDPVSGVSPWLPWLFIGTAVVVVAALFLVRQRRSRKSVDAARTDRRSRNRAIAQLSVLSEQILQLDGLAQDGSPRKLLARATERYGTARDLLLQDGDLDVARSALDDAADLLTTTAKELDVPLAGVLPGQDEPAAKGARP